MKSDFVRGSIPATPDCIRARTEAAQSTRWNNSNEKVDGKTAPGEQLTVRPKMNPGCAFHVVALGLSRVRSRRIRTEY
jgi:hypothetical protein